MAATERRHVAEPVTASGFTQAATSGPVAALEVNGLTKSYGGKAAACNITFSVAPGTLVGLLGPNGAGKTTTLACIAGLTSPDQGSIHIYGIDARQRGREARALLSVATQHLALYPGLSVQDNLRFSAELVGVRKRDVNGEVARVVELLELNAFLGGRVDQLSVGQQRLAHVASAFVGHPRLMLLDEPTAGLDLSARALVLRATRQACDEGAAVVYSTHYLQEIEDLGDRVVVLHRGRVIAQGDVQSLVREHGGGRVEIDAGETVVVHEGCDVAKAISGLRDGDVISAVRVVKPSLDAVFLALTGSMIGESGEVAECDESP